ncbi:hypothetical protein M011DRAFT_404683 [Sporormia fimetaria CBS 119925]|uniref:BHLH domain-containing protein n=1 Tax=Sporormia fimetaria CBS 119925 TaxID=1340428 RepID=A0A6A6V834_9PLEO|nr:hypothetical protein M011DRAFT_404683 [Sporormia fimetaria CBS 119925]
MAGKTAPHGGDNKLEIEKVAVGPYCLFDTHTPPLSADACSTVDNPRGKMNGAPMSNGFAFNNGGREQWVMGTSADDYALAAPSTDGLPPSDWTQWMQWDPASSQPVEAKQLNAQGQLCMLPQDQQRPSLLNRRQHARQQDASLGLQSEPIGLLSAPLQPQAPNVPFTFGGDLQNPPAFDFDAATLSSPSSGGANQPGGFYSPPLWQQHGVSAPGVISPPGFEHLARSSAQANPLRTPSLQHSPSSNNGPTSSSSDTSSPEPVPPNSKKRKSTSEESDDGPASKKEKQPVKKTAHNMIEKRYRTNLNDKINALREAVPSLRVMLRQNGGQEDEDEPEDLEGLTPAHKLNKATVLTKATEYIRHLEKRNKRMHDEILQLKGRLESYERMAITGQLALHGAARTPDGTRFHDEPYAPMPPMVHQALPPPQGLIPVPENMANLHRAHAQQAHYAPQQGAYYPGPNRAPPQGPPVVNGRGNGMLGKLMVGSLAGLMLLEGFAEREQSGEEPAGRGLFALPFDLVTALAPRVSMGGASAHLPLAKLLLVFGAVFYLIAPLFTHKPKSKKKSVQEVHLSHVPSLASPVEVRRKAWLTAIQTVWVPGHSFWLEVAALGLKMLKLSTRKIIGWNGYAFLTGTTKEHEAARIKAWNIALDAQLTGGDAEISKSRLVLTLMASGTLPDTPARLMLKALHLRVLLWELAKPGDSGWRVLDHLSAKLAASYWNAARSEQKIAVHMASKPDSGVEPLPDHLAALLEMECDAVLMPTIIQRAYNLAWNKPSAECTSLDDNMDTVVGDFSICSPLDALAAWWSCYVLKRGLASCLATKNCTPKENAIRDLELASRTAPPTSQAHLRALVAHAIVHEEDRAKNVSTALQALPFSPSVTPSGEVPKVPTVLMNVVSDTPVAADIRRALTLTKALSLIDSGDVTARSRAVYYINNTCLNESTISLLSFVAGYKVLMRFLADAALRNDAGMGLERLSSSLRIWIGQETGRRSGLTNKVRGRIVRGCLEASKTLVGIKEVEEVVDDGYVSGSGVESASVSVKE